MSAHLDLFARDTAVTAPARDPRTPVLKVTTDGFEITVHLGTHADPAAWLLDLASTAAALAEQLQPAQPAAAVAS